jgi:hypothetical protein
MKRIRAGLAAAKEKRVANKEAAARAKAGEAEEEEESEYETDSDAEREEEAERVAAAAAHEKEEADKRAAVAAGWLGAAWQGSVDALAKARSAACISTPFLQRAQRRCDRGRSAAARLRRVARTLSRTRLLGARGSAARARALRQCARARFFALTHAPNRPCVHPPARGADGGAGGQADQRRRRCGCGRRQRCCGCHGGGREQRGKRHHERRCRGRRADGCAARCGRRGGEGEGDGRS